jgi:hypothetical protein
MKPNNERTEIGQTTVRQLLGGHLRLSLGSWTIIIFALIALVTISVSFGARHIMENPPEEPQTIVDLRKIDTSSHPPDFRVAAEPYLASFGISVIALEPKDSELIVQDNIAIYKAGGIRPSKSQNILMQVNNGNSGVESFTLTFATPCESVTFTRAGLYAAGANGVTHPAWSAHALDAQGRELSSHSEGLVRSFSSVLPRTYTLIAPGLEGISAVRFDGDDRRDGKSFAGYKGILIEELAFSPRKK